MKKLISPNEYREIHRAWLADGLEAVKQSDQRTQADLAEALGIGRTGVSKMVNGKHDIDPRYYPIIEKFIGVPRPTVEVAPLVRDPATTPARRPKSNASFPPQYQKFPDESIPLLGQTVGGPNGRFILNGQELARVFCPPNLVGVEGAYAVQIYGTSGEPRFYAGETAWINPHTPVRQGDDVIAQIYGDDDDTVSSYVKRFVSQSSKVLRLYQYNPDDGESHDLEFPTDRVFSVHKIVFHAML